MKSIILTAASLILSLSAAQAEIDTRRHIEVSGTAELQVEPDRAVWSIAIRGEADSVSGASQQLDESTQALQKALKEAKFPDTTIRLSAISSGRHYTGEDENKVFAGYYAERKAEIELKDLQQRQQIESLLLSDNRIEISKVSTLSSQHDAHQRKVLLNATATAKSKAGDLAAALGAELGQVLTIQQGSPSYLPGLYIRSNSIAAPTFATPTEMEKLSYSATITVKFELK
ncbi:Uncharacterized conserved protein YggE, contains kinase-interacting SIMPL domain [Rubritalea squalenifaciens DSM 18772]|uniref:Uncharacterized conserved protein YggE, contains kinase-interacting SIMPL domain n=1 Tax=Rubritalea squalenifaciens DSM 18772 TaxID=1123071 RepID=A0A1M6C4A1_9BACT|nr:SIMPL domain-containing protein [Rubritalea squalenifaciens]SHI55564.1 Uncharacterized conserved protein YggE, contains kinase-interacting SIMPL domain [Rubritalea squalenifaciens DSM 18772]